jgi:integrase
MASRRRGSIQARGAGRWLVRISLGVNERGRQVRINKTVRGAKGDATKALTALLKLKDDGVPTGVSRQTLGQWIEEYVSVWHVDVADRTRNDTRALFERYLWPDTPHHLSADKVKAVADTSADEGEENRPVRHSSRKDDRLVKIAQQLRATKLTALTPTHIQAFVNVLRECGLAPRTVRMAHGAIRACLNTALSQKKIPFNSATHAKLPRQTRREMRFLTPEQAQAFLSASEAEQERYGSSDDQMHLEGVYALFSTLLLSGLRLGEALALQWSDLDGVTVRVQRAVTQDAQRHKTVGPTKTGRNRAVPLGERALRALQRHRVAQVKWKLKIGELYQDQGLIFANEIGGLLDGQNVTGRYFKPLLRKAELPDIRLYDLRHSHATLLMAAGEHPKVVQERLGHATIQLTLDTYTHVVEGLQARASERLEALLSQHATPARA